MSKFLRSPRDEVRQGRSGRSGQPLVGSGSRASGTPPSSGLWPPVSVNGGEIGPFRRRSRALQVRRPSRWVRWARPLVGALLVVGLPAAVVLWLSTSPLFAVDHIDLEAPPRVDEAWALERLEPLRGENLLWLPPSRITARLESHPWIAAVEATKVPPRGLAVTVRERRPGALLVTEGGWTWVDRQGRTIAPLGDGETTPEGVLVLRPAVSGTVLGEPGPELAPRVQVPSSPRRGPFGWAGLVRSSERAMAVADELERAQPAWRRELVEIEMLGEEDFRLWTDTLPFPLLVQAGAVEGRIRLLERLLPELEGRYAVLESVDLRFADRVVVRPGAEGSGEAVAGGA